MLTHYLTSMFGKDQFRCATPVVFGMGGLANRTIEGVTGISKLAAASTSRVAAARRICTSSGAAARHQPGILDLVNQGPVTYF
jgi:hypothetical protein